VAALSGCGTPGVPQPPSLELPRPVSDLRATRKGNKAQLAWTVPVQTTDRQNLRRIGATLICRSLQPGMTKCNKVGEIPTAQLLAQYTPPPGKKKESGPPAQGTKTKKKQAAPPQATYVDEIPPELIQQSPEGFVTYAVETLNSARRSAGLSNQVDVPLAPTLPAPSQPTAEVTNEGVRLSWTGGVAPESDRFSYRYRVYRRLDGTNNDVLIGELPISPQGTLLDTTMGWEQTYWYHVTTATIVSLRGKPAIVIEGDDSPSTRVFVHDVFPPAAPSGLQAVFSSVGQKPFIDLTWAPNTDPDLAGYNVYRRENGGQWVRLNPSLLPVTSFRDNDVASGRRYTYAVTAVDVRGNESTRSEETSETVPQ